MTQKILIYSPYSDWWLHSLYEITIGHGLRLRGAQIKFICCNAAFPECDVSWAAVRPRTPQTCVNCMHHHDRVFSGMQMESEWIGQYVPSGELQRATAWAATLPAEALADAKFDNLPLGEWVKSSVHSHFRLAVLDFTEQRIQDGYRKYLHGAAIAVAGLRNVFDQFKPTTLFTLNGRFFSHRVAMELALQQGIRVICHERGTRDNTLWLTENEPIVDLNTLNSSWAQWKDVPLNDRQLALVQKMYLAREEGKDTGWRSWISKKTDDEDLRRQLSIPQGRPVVTIFTSSDDELAAGDYPSPHGNQYEFVRATLAYFANYPEYYVLVRLHPNLDEFTGKAQQSIDRTAEIVNRAGANVRLIMPKEAINSYQLIHLSHACLCFSSTISLEATVRGKPTIVAGGGRYYGHDFVYSPRSVEDYERILGMILLSSPGIRMLQAAYRYGYHFFFRRSFDFPLVRVIEVHRAEPTYNSLDALLPGKDETLDRICSIILGGAPIHHPPQPNDRISDAAEIAFLSRPFEERIGMAHVTNGEIHGGELHFPYERVQPS